VDDQVNWGKNSRSGETLVSSGKPEGLM